MDEKKEKEIGIEDATKPELEVTATAVDLGQTIFNEEKDEGVVITKEKESDVGDHLECCPKCGEPFKYLKNVRIEAGISRTTNLGGMEFIKINAGIAGDTGRKDRRVSWGEAWMEVELQLAEEMLEQLTTIKNRKKC